MSLVKYRLREVASDFGVAPKEVTEIISKFSEKPKSNTQVLTEEELNIVFDQLTKNHPVASLEKAFAAQTAVRQEAPKAEAPKQEAPKAEQPKNAKPQQGGNKTGNNANNANSGNHSANNANNNAPKADKPKEPERKRERRVVDTSAVQVNAARFDDRVDNLVSERVQDYARGKQRIGGGKQQQNKKRDNKFVKGNKAKNEEQERLRRLQMEQARKAVLTVKIPEEITVGELASRMKKTAGEVIKLLMKNGVMAGINQTIDFDTAEYVATEMGCKVEKEVTVTIEEQIIDDHVDTADELETRAPVVVVMGHVDHGKTSLLDAIRKTSVTAGEAGGITQHIGAYTVDVNGKSITFLDTPGHAAFTSMRARGAMCTDIAILVVAADDGIMPQTVEAINHAKAANVPIIVAMNKMDKPDVNPDKVKQGLVENNLVPEEWGGDVMIVPVSAKTGMGIDNLLDAINLVAEMQELKANPDREAKGTIIEARLDKGKGPVASIIVQNGTLHTGDNILSGTTMGRVRAMFDDKGKPVKSAGPSMAVSVLGLEDVPNAGDSIVAVDQSLMKQVQEERKNKERESMIKEQGHVTLDDVFAQVEEGKMKNLNLIIKADVQGSVEAVKQSLEKMSNEEVRVKVIHAQAGAINESDVMLAESANAIIIGFNVRPDAKAKKLAETSKVDVRMYRIIYELLDDIEKALKGMLTPKTQDVLTGKCEVRQTFQITGVGTVAGCYVTEGKIVRGGKLRIYRDDIMICEGGVKQLKRFKDDVKEVNYGYECGCAINGFNEIRVGDIIECYVTEEIKAE